MQKDEMRTAKMTMELVQQSSTGHPAFRGTVLPYSSPRRIELLIKRSNKWDIHSHHRRSGMMHLQSQVHRVRSEVDI